VTAPIYIPIPGLDQADALAIAQNSRSTPSNGPQLTPAQARHAASVANIGSYQASAGTKANPYTSTISVLGSPGTSAYDQGSGLLGTLSLPAGLAPDSYFAWSASAPDSHYQQSGNQRGPDGLNTSVTRHGQTLTEMTMAGSLSWLRNLAVQAPDQYNEIVMQLVSAGYLDFADARFGSYTTVVGNKFLKSAADVWSMNQDEGVGQLTTWGDHMNALIEARKAAGQIDENGLPIGAGGAGGPQAPTRIDKWSDPETVKAAGNAAAKNILGRDLNDAELSQFSGIFHAAEQSFNDQQWAALQQQTAGGGSASVSDQPNPSASALNYVKTDPGLGPERTEQALGSYLGVLRQMTGLGSGGVSGAIA
jgi:hypothetical protein